MINCHIPAKNLQGAIVLGRVLVFSGAFSLYIRAIYGRKDLICISSPFAMSQNKGILSLLDDDDDEDDNEEHGAGTNQPAVSLLPSVAIC